MPNCILDWAATGAFLSGVGALLAGIAATFAVFVTLRQWQTRNDYKARAEDARSILVTFFEGRQVLRTVRSGLIEPYEIEKAEKAILEQRSYLEDREKQRLVQTITTLSRIGQHNDYWRKVASLLPIAKAVFGDEAELSLRAILEAKREIEVAAEIYPDSVGDRALTKELQQVLWTLKPENDPLMAKLEKAEDHLQKLLSPLLRPAKARPRLSAASH
ncbi:MAG: hypothetical protein ACK4GT_19915 [Pararhodobacter sp.]